MLTFLEAIKQLNLVELEEAISAGINVNTPCSNGKLPLENILASFFHRHTQNFNPRCLEATKLLLNAGAQTESINNEGKTYLQRLCALPVQRKNTHHNLSFFAQNCLNAEETNFVCEVVKLFMAYGANKNSVDEEGNTLLLLALNADNTMLAQQLLEAGVEDINHRNKQGDSALSVSCAQELQDMVKHLCKLGANLHPEGTHLFSLLETSRNNPDLTLYLLTQGARSQTQDLIDFLCLAEMHQHQALQDYCFAQGVALYQRADGSTALHHVRTLPVFQCLVSRGANINSIEKNQHTTPLLAYFKHARFRPFDPTLVNTYRLFIANGADVHLQDNEGNGVWHYSMEIFANEDSLDYLTFLNLFFKQQVAIDTRNKAGETALHTAAQSFNIPGLAFLLAQGADTSLKDKSGSTAIEKIMYRPGYRECSPKTLAVLLDLLRHSPDDQLPANAEALFLMAVTYNWQVLADALLTRGLPKEVLQKPACIQSALFNPYQPHLDMARWLHHQGCQLDAISGWKTLSQAIYNCELAVILFLLDELNVSLTPATPDNQTLFHFLASCPINAKTDSQLNNMIKELVRRLQILKINVNQKDTHGKTALALALSPMYSFFWIVPLLLRLKATPPQELNLKFQLFFFYLKQHDYMQIAHLIREALPDDKIQYLSEGAHYAIETTDEELLQLLQREGLDINAPIIKNQKPQRLLEHAILKAEEQQRNKGNPEKYLAMAVYLIRAGAEKYFSSTTFSSCLHVAVQNGWVDLVERLLQPPCPFPVNTLASYQAGFSLLTCPILAVAVLTGNTLLCRLLLSHQADPHFKTPEEETYLHTACSTGDAEMVDLFLAQGLSATAISKNTFNPTPLLCALSNTRTSSDEKEKIMTVLIARGAYIDSLNLRRMIAQPLSPSFFFNILENLPKATILATYTLHRAIETGNEPLVDFLLAQTYTAELLASRDQLGRTPLHLCALPPGNRTLFTQLTHAGGDIHTRDYHGYDVATHALFYNTISNLNLPLPTHFDINAFKILRRQLVETAELTHIDITQRLWKVSEYAYKLINIFGEVATAQTYIRTHQDLTSRQPLHDICLFQLPLTDGWHREAWARLLLLHGTAIIRYIYFAIRIEEILQHTPQSLEEVIEAAKKVTYARESEHPALATFLAQHKITEEGFNLVLENYRVKTHDHLPDIMLEGEVLNQSRYYFKKLATDDWTGFVLGSLTNCCQNVGAAGHSCTMHGMTSLYGGFYAIFKKPNPKDVSKQEELVRLMQNNHSFDAFIAALKDPAQRRKYQQRRKDYPDDETAYRMLYQEFTDALQDMTKNELVAQSWAWLSEENDLVFDSWERTFPIYDELCPLFLKHAAEQMIQHHGIKRVLLGKAGRTPERLPFETLTPGVRPKDYDAYRDSQEQWVIATQAMKPKPELSLSVM